MPYSWQLNAVASYSTVLFYGLVVTVALAAATIVLSSLLGVLLGLARCRKDAVGRVAAGYVELFRAVPILVMIVWIVYAMPLLLGFKLPLFESAVAGLTLCGGAYLAEIVRAGVQAVPKGQVEAARSLGIPEYEIILSIILPQAVSMQAPAIAGQYSEMLKNTSLVSFVGVADLFHAATTAATITFRPMEFYTVLGVAYTAMILPLSLLSKRAETNAVRGGK
ncbi:MAG: amino acid ABC transporter permease [Candidatus Micrarchaeota archaeon]